MKKLLTEKTTWIGGVGLMILVAMIAALIAGKIDATAFATVMGSVATFLGGALIWFAKDKNKTEQ